MDTRNTVRKSATGRPFSDESRDREIICQFRAGSTSVEIAPSFGLSAKGVLQVLRRYGVRRSEGGKEVAAKLRAAARLLAQQHQFAVERGAVLSNFDSFEQCQDAHRKFMDQQARAGQRGIGWQLTFAEWWSIWLRSGQWANRGRRNAESAVMARRGDVGPYSSNNVYITTLSGNFIESHFVRGHRIKGASLHALSVFRSPIFDTTTDGNAS